MSSVGNAELLRKLDSAKKESTGYQRVTSLLDTDSFVEIDCFAKSGGEVPEAVAGFGTIEGCPTYVFSQNSDREGGAMSKAQAAKISKIYAMAVKTGAPVVGLYDSAGGSLREGADLLAAYGEILLQSNNLSGVVPQISVILGPCLGTTAMIAAGADLVIMTEQSELTVATNGEGGSAQEAAELGVSHLTVKDEQSAFQTVRRLISILPSNNLSGNSILNLQSENGVPAPTADSGQKEIIEALCDENSFLELGEAFGKPTVTGLAEIGGSTAGVVSLHGVIGADSCSKAARFVRFCDSFSIPVVTLVNADHFETVREASKLSSAYSEATTPKVTVITGSAYGSVYIAAAGRGANADYTLAWVDAVVSPLAPETAVAFLWRDRLAGSENPVEDRKKLVEEYRQTEAAPFAAAANGFIEDVILPEETRCRVISSLEMLAGKRVSGLPKKHSNIQL